MNFFGDPDLARAQEETGAWKERIAQMPNALLLTILRARYGDKVPLKAYFEDAMTSVMCDRLERALLVYTSPLHSAIMLEEPPRTTGLLEGD